MRNILRLTSLLFLSVLSCQPDEVTPGDPADFPLAEGSFLYVLEGDLRESHEGTAFFYRAGDDVVIYCGSRTDSIRLEIAYEETERNDIGQFPVRQNTTFGGYLMVHVNGDQRFWQLDGELTITYSSPDTVIGRMDELKLGYMDQDTLREISVTGRFMAI